MGESVPTTTHMLDRFEKRHSAFRHELRPADRAVFDELVNAARERSNVLNRYPDLDYERVVSLAMIIHLGIQVARQGELLDKLERELQEARSAPA